jgi:rhodanese-related sulfurtransferase
MIKSIKHYSAQEASLKVKKERNVVLLDVRTDTERKQGSIRGSYHIPITSIATSENELKKFKDAEIICYCRTGNRSLNAAAKLKKLGFNAANLRGGMIRWNAAGLK